MALTAAAMLTACGDSENEFTIGTCYFVFDNSVHQDATLASAMNPAAPGIFCTITRGMEKGADKFFFSNNAGVSSSQLPNGIEQSWPYFEYNSEFKTNIQAVVSRLVQEKSIDTAEEAVEAIKTECAHLF